MVERHFRILVDFVHGDVFLHRRFVVRRHFDRFLGQFDLELLDSLAIRLNFVGASRQTNDRSRLFDSRRESKEKLMNFVQFVDQFVQRLSVHVDRQTFVAFVRHDRRTKIGQSANRMLLHERTDQIETMFAFDVDAFHRIDARLGLFLRWNNRLSGRTPNRFRRRREEVREDRFVFQMSTVDRFAFDQRRRIVDGRFRFLPFRSRCFGDDLLPNVSACHRGFDAGQILLQHDSILHDFSFRIELDAFQRDVFHVFRQRFDFRTRRIEGQVANVGQVTLRKADLFHLFQKLIILKMKRPIDVQAKRR